MEKHRAVTSWDQSAWLWIFPNQVQLVGRRYRVISMLGLFRVGVLPGKYNGGGRGQGN